MNILTAFGSAIPVRTPTVFYPKNTIKAMKWMMLFSVVLFGAVLSAQDVSANDQSLPQATLKTFEGAEAKLFLDDFTGLRDGVTKA
ncbi:MAG: hypothetical protein LBV12_01275 [Puniceicoccales bacterium]|jgi:hypothetical protein|nr:hypothetical protein [Puniceicoccales bacterium]